MNQFGDQALCVKVTSPQSFGDSQTLADRSWVIGPADALQLPDDHGNLAASVSTARAAARRCRPILRLLPKVMQRMLSPLLNLPAHCGQRGVIISFVAEELIVRHKQGEAL